MKEKKKGSLLAQCLCAKGRKIEKQKLSKAHSLFSKSLKRRKIYATKRSERREHKELTYKVRAQSLASLWYANYFVVRLWNGSRLVRQHYGMQRSFVTLLQLLLLFSSRLGWCSVYRLCSLCEASEYKIEKNALHGKVRCPRYSERGEESTRNLDQRGIQNIKS